MARRGSLPVYSEELAKQVLIAIRAGATYAHAAAHAGISADTLDRWRKGRAGAPAEFAARMAAAEGGGAVVSLAQIQLAAQNGDWRASAWILEHRHATSYGKIERHELTGKHGGPIQSELTVLGKAVERVAAEEGLDTSEVLAEATAILAKVSQ